MRARNTSSSSRALPAPPRRAEAHSIDPVPFALWNGRDRDEVTKFDEDSVRLGRYGSPVVSHLDLLRLLGGTAELRPLDRAGAPGRGELQGESGQ
jgi:hypothetical protein